MEHQDNLLSELAIDASGAQHLRSIASWGKFLSIIGFIACALFVVLAFFAGAIMSSIDSYGSYGSGLGAVMTVVYLIVAIIYFIPTLFLFQASVKLRSAIDATDQVLLNEGLGKMKSCFKFWGIVTIVLISFYLLAFIFGGMAAMMGR
jgi:uncharacterized membrane protein